MGMKETEKVPFDSMPPLIRGSFLTKEQVEKLKEPFKDVVSVVRCKDCKYAHKTYDGDCKYCDMFTDDDGNPIERYRSGDWFCADGERIVK